ncbi:predicted protein [Naegleria gruberi]|uniref:Predicted protein n=1 Tax=Naegleria gruberi TaxID=5762 RepID=D2V1U4_NAEGR|nr:uncharacterized protein NAEGRDRAFT_62698 [Naegleria gruberi]EFC49222.1 predicted protein [Naegleria gruberi]|eukprot:XP_002681966.1 predicted protein [Naegleria gruberi strain NEG-M]
MIQQDPSSSEQNQQQQHHHNDENVPKTKQRKLSIREVEERHTFRIASFNVENLYGRYCFNKAQMAKISKQCLGRKGSLEFGVNDVQTNLTIADEDSKRITAEAIKQVNADVICLMEVESLQVLDSFNEKYLQSMNYAYSILIDGRDPRSIDVGVLSRYPIVNIRSNRHATYPGEKTRYIFSRDLLELDIEFPGNNNLTIYATHLTSMSKGREESKDRRLVQVDYICDRIEKSWKDKNYKGNFIVLGDMNDYNDSETSLGKLLKHDHMADIISQRLPSDEQWTHYYNRGNAYNQLDYMFISKHLLLRNPRAKPVIFRKGLPKRAHSFTGKRIKGVGQNEPKASDHCPVYVDLSFD